MRWLDRCIASHKRPEDQNLFAIVQGGLSEDLRTRCAKGNSHVNWVINLFGSVGQSLNYTAVFSS